MVLVDSNVPPQESDKKLVAYLQSVQRPFVVTATKADRLSGNKLTNSLETLRGHLQTDKVLPFSTRTGAGRDELWQEILACAQEQSSAPE